MGIFTKKAGNGNNDNIGIRVTSKDNLKLSQINMTGQPRNERIRPKLQMFQVQSSLEVTFRC